jgi:phosphate starvation-inducible membrane PsiE
MFPLLRNFMAVNEINSFCSFISRELPRLLYGFSFKTTQHPCLRLSIREHFTLIKRLIIVTVACLRSRQLNAVALLLPLISFLALRTV